MIYSKEKRGNKGFFLVSSKKILTLFLLLGGVSSLVPCQASSLNLFLGGSAGYQRGTGSIKGETIFFDPGGPTTFNGSYPGRLGKNSPAADLFFEITAEISPSFHIGLRPYYHRDNFKSSFIKNDLIDPVNDVVETSQISLQRQNAYGLLVVPQIPYKEYVFYGIVGIEFSRFNAEMNLSQSLAGVPQPVFNSVLSKKVLSSAAVFGLGFSKNFGRWSLFAEGQYKQYKAKNISSFGVDEFDFQHTRSIKFSPKFGSFMVGVKFKLI